MGPKKRPQRTRSTSVKRKKKDLEECKDLKETHESDQVLLSNDEDPEDSYLSLLPNEVLLHIYKYLSPVDLASISELGNQRLNELTYTVREANLSLCRRGSLQLVSAFFTRSRMKYINKLNFNNYFLMKPHELASLICRCKNLITLSVVDCGLAYGNVVSILESCRKLEEFAWNIEEDVKSLDVCCPRMKRVFLFCNIMEVSLNSVYYTIRNFPKVQSVWINFASDCLAALPFIGMWLKSSCVSSSVLVRQLTLITNCFQSISITNDLKFLSAIINSDVHGSSPSNPNDPVKSVVYNYPPYVQIRSIIEDISLLSSGPPDVYSSMVVILTPDIINVSENLVTCVEQIAGNKLKHLSLQSEAHYVAPFELPPPMSDEESIIACNTLEKIFLTSTNVTILNLTTVHFNAGSPITAITQLPYLKVLNIPSCAFSNSAKVKNSVKFELSDVVKSCPQVEDFVLNCCVNDSHKITEDDVVCIKDWSYLKHLSIYSLVFRSCRFLQRVADSCVYLQSLSLITVAPKKACIFINDIIYLLKKAKNLTFLRINEENFYPMYERFWAAIGEAANLEGICIITQSTSPVDKRTVLEGIKKLKYLHLFHFFAPRASERLYCEARKSMQDHGIRNIKIENCFNVNSFTVLSGLKYYHQQPNFCCQHMHLKEINIF